MARKPRGGALSLLLEDFGKRIKRFREAASLTQEDVAYAIGKNLGDVGISVQTIRNWEAGRNEPRLEYIEQFAAICGVSLTNLIGRITDSTGDELRIAEGKEQYSANIKGMISESIENLEKLRKEIELGSEQTSA